MVQMDTESSMLYVARLNKGLSATHLLHRDEIKVISAKIKAETDVFFVSERRTALSLRGFGLQSSIIASWAGCPPWAQEHLAHSHLHGCQSGKVERFWR